MKPTPEEVAKEIIADSVSVKCSEDNFEYRNITRELIAAAIRQRDEQAENELYEAVGEKHDQLARAVTVLHSVLGSANPHPVEHPAMFVKFKEARVFLASLGVGEQMRASARVSSELNASEKNELVRLREQLARAVELLRNSVDHITTNAEETQSAMYDFLASLEAGKEQK